MLNPEFEFVLEEGAFMPVLSTEGSAAYDLAVKEDFLLQPGRNLIPLGFSVKMSEDYKAYVRARSGFSAKGFEVYLNPESAAPTRIQADVITGLIDSDFTKPINVIVRNTSPIVGIIRKGTRIAQLEFAQVVHPVFKQVDKLDETEHKGIGSTGTATKTTSKKGKK